MQRVVGLIFMIFSLSVFAQEKVAITMGADHEGGTQFVKEQNIHARKVLIESGYKVSSFFGDAKKAKEFGTATKSYTRPFSLENVQKKLDLIYSKPCSERPKQLMINFVAHGSRNGKDAKTKKSIPRHSVNGVKKSSDGTYKKRRIYADEFANAIKKQKRKEPNCEFPKLAIFDHSCKSGASTSVFKGLGCVMTSTSAFNSAGAVFIHDTFDNMKKKRGSSMSDLHLDMLVNQDVSLVNIDYKDGKKVLQKVYNDTNQISGCGDGNQVNYGAYAKETSKKVAPMCQEFVPMFQVTRDSEIDSVRNVVKRLRFDGELDKSALASVAGVDKSKVPESSELSQKLDELIEEDKNEIDKMSSIAIEESKLMGHPDVMKNRVCSLSSAKGRSSHLFSNTDTSKKMALTLCRAIYDPRKEGDVTKEEDKISRKARNCAAGFNSKKVLVDVKDLFRLKREQDIYQTKRSIGHMKMNLHKRGEKYGLGSRVRSTYEILTSTVNKCLKSMGSSGTDAQKKALKFFNENYKKEIATCTTETIGCHKAKAEKRSDEIKQYLSYARGYSFLSCKAKLKKSDDLKACEDYKI